MLDQQVVRATLTKSYRSLFSFKPPAVASLTPSSAYLRQNALEKDTSANQRVSKAVTESFVAAQVGGMINSLSSLSAKDRVVVSKVFLLVSSPTSLFSFCERKAHY